MMKKATGFVILALFLFPWCFQALGETQPTLELDRFTLVEDTTQGAVWKYRCEQETIDTSQTGAFLFSIPFDVTYEVMLQDPDYEIMTERNKWRQPKQSDRPMPGNINEAVKLEEVFWHDTRVLKVAFNPYFPRTSGNDAYRFRSATIRLVYGGQSPRTEPFTDGPFESLYKAMLVNYESSKTRRGRKPLGARIETPDYQRDAAGEPSLKFNLSEPGLYKIPLKNLSAFGELYDQRDQVSLWRDGEQVPCAFLSSSQDSRLQQDCLLFYGAVSENPYSRDVTYWLTAGRGAPPPRRTANMPRVTDAVRCDSFIERTVLEKDKVFPNSGEGPEQWFWLSIPANYPGFIPLDFDLPGILSATGTVDMWIDGYSSATKDVLAELHINDATPQQFPIVPRSSQTLQPSVTARELKRRENTIRVYIKPNGQEFGPREFAFIDKIRIEYPRELDLRDGGTVANIPEDSSGNFRDFLLKGLASDDVLQIVDVTQPASPEWMNPLVHSTTDGFFLTLGPESRRILLQKLKDIPELTNLERDVPTNLHSPDNQYDYIIISHKDFLEELEALKSYRERSGNRVLLLDSQDVYDEFGHGNKSADAIRAFLQYAMSAWERPAPSYVLLVGDSNWDFWNKKGLGIKDYMPPYVPPGKPKAPPQDFWYVKSNEDTGLTDYLIGRLPMKHSTEVANFISKLKMYENEAPTGWWKVKMLMFCDDGFERELEKLLDRVADTGMMGMSIYQSEYPYTTSLRLKKRGHKIKFCTSATARIVQEMDDGCLTAFYMGHGGAIVMSEERIFLGTDRGDSDILKLRNAPKFPVLYSMSCLTGLFNFDEPYPGVSIGEEWLRHEKQGGIGSFLPTSKGSTTTHLLLADGIIGGIFEHRLPTFGAIFAHARSNFWMQRSDIRIPDEYVYSGDPACQVQAPKYRVHMEPESIMADVKLAHDVVVRGEVDSEALKDASGELRLYSKNGDILWSVDQFRLRDGQFETRFPVSTLGEMDARLMCYVWNPATGDDGFGSLDCYIRKPDLAIRNVRFVPDIDENKLSAVVDVQNKESFDWDKPVTVAWTVNGSPMTSTIDRIESEAVASATTQFEAGSGIYRVKVSVNDERLSLESDDSNNSSEKTFLWQGPELADTSKLELTPLDVKLAEISAFEKVKDPELIGAIQVEVWNYGAQAVDSLKCVAISQSSGETISEMEDISIEAGTQRVVTLPIKSLPDDIDVQLLRSAGESPESATDGANLNGQENPESPNE